MTDEYVQLIGRMVRKSSMAKNAAESVGMSREVGP